MRKLLSFFFASVFILAISLLPSSLMAAEPFDINLLTNPSCDNNDYAGWTRTDGGSGWKAENNVWSSSYVECKMTQTVNLLTAGFTEEQLDALPFVLAAGSFVCPCQFAAKTTGFAKINITFLDASNAQISNAILADRSYITTIPWDTYTNQLQIPTGTRSIKFYFAGKDAYNWGGQYGPQFDNMWLSLSTTPAAEHAVTTASVEHGSFVVDKATANAGETVKITVNPATNYGLKAFNVKTSTGSTIAVAADSTFIMPAGFDVTVSGEFWKTGGLEVSCAVVDNGSFSVDKTIANAGETVKITVNPATNYGLKAFNVKKSDNTSIAVAADSTFIMPAGFAVTVSGEFWEFNEVTIENAFFEGFESGNLNRWAQERESGSNLWGVNTLTSNNRTPYAGSYNATLRWENTCWLFTPLYLHADTEYKFEMYARQDEWTTSYANITVMLGSQENSTAMTHSIVAKSGITNGDYTQLSGSITLTESKEYFLGIKGYISLNPYYLSIDNIKLWIEDPTTSLKSADDDKGLNVYAIARTIVIENSNPDQKVQVYNISGHCIANTVNTVIAVPTNGLYLVRIGDETHKVLVK